MHSPADATASKSRLVLTFLVLPFWYLLTRVVPDVFQKSSKMVVCVCVRHMFKYEVFHIKSTLLLLLQPFYGPLDFVRDYLGEPVPER